MLQKTCFLPTFSVLTSSLLLTFLHQAQPIGRAVRPSGLPHGEISGEAGWPGRGGGPAPSKGPWGRGCVSDSPNCSHRTTPVPKPQAQSFAFRKRIWRGWGDSGQLAGTDVWVRAPPSAPNGTGKG